MAEEWVDLKAADGGPVEPASYDWPKLLEELNRWLRLRTTPIGMKLFQTVEEMEAIPRAFGAPNRSTPPIKLLPNLAVWDGRWASR